MPAFEPKYGIPCFIHHPDGVVDNARPIIERSTRSHRPLLVGLAVYDYVLGFGIRPDVATSRSECPLASSHLVPRQVSSGESVKRRPALFHTALAKFRLCLPCLMRSAPPSLERDSLRDGELAGSVCHPKMPAPEVPHGAPRSGSSGAHGASTCVTAWDAI